MFSFSYLPYSLRVACFNIDHSKRFASVSSNEELADNLVKFVYENKYPDILSFAEASGTTIWVPGFEERTNYQGQTRSSTYSHFYVAWRSDRFKLIQDISSTAKRYTGVLLEDVQSASIILYIAVHLPRKESLHWPKYARHILSTYEQKYSGHCTCIIAGDFNRGPADLGYIFSRKFTLAITDTKEKTTTGKNCIDNIMIDKPHDISEISIIKSCPWFSHYPLIASLTYYN